MKKCEHIPAKSRLVRGWRLLTCAECRQSRRPDSRINAEIKSLRNLSIPAQGVEQTLLALQNAPGGMPFSVELARKRNRLLSPKYMRVYGVVAAGLAITAGVTLHELNVDPVMNIPNPVMPHPNAFDYFNEAGKMAEDMKAESKTISDMETDLRDLRPHTPTFTAQQRAEALAKFDTVLTRMREGFKYPFQNPPLRSFSQLLPQFARYRALARILAMEARVYEDQADWEDAMNSHLDCLYLGGESPRNGPLIAELVGVAIQAIGRAHTQEIIENLTAEEAKTAIKRMEGILSEEVSYAQTLREEKIGLQASLMEIFHKANWRTSMISLSGWGSENNNDTWSNRMQALSLMFVNKRASMKNISDYCDAIIAEAELPYQNGRPAPPVPTDRLSQLVCPVFSQAGFKYTENQAANRMTLTALALQAYRVEHKAYPSTLQELVDGGYLKELPKDSFNFGQPLKYLRVNGGAKYILYSVGPNGKDDGGVVAENPDFWKNLPPTQNPNAPAPAPAMMAPKKPVHLDASQLRALHNLVPDSTGDFVYQANTR